MPRVDAQDLGSKLSYVYKGPYLVTAVHRGHTVSLQLLSSGEPNRQRVSISQLKLPAYFMVNNEIHPNVIAPAAHRRLFNPGAKFTPARPGDNEE